MAIPMVGFWRDTVKDKENDAWLRGVALTFPAAVYVGLSVAPAIRTGPVFDSSVGTGYARVLVPTTSWVASSAGLITNSAAITFPAATANWIQVFSVFASDTSTLNSSSTSFLWMANLIPDSTGYGVVVATGKVLSFGIGSISIQR